MSYDYAYARPGQDVAAGLFAGLEAGGGETPPPRRENSFPMRPPLSRNVPTRAPSPARSPSPAPSAPGNAKKRGLRLYTPAARAASAEPRLPSAIDEDEVDEEMLARFRTLPRIRTPVPAAPRLTDVSGVSFLVDARAGAATPAPSGLPVPGNARHPSEDFAELFLPPPVSLDSIEPATQAELGVAPSAWAEAAAGRHSDPGANQPDARNWHLAYSDSLFGHKPLPSGRSDVYRVERWLKQQVGEAQEEKRAMEETRTRDTTAYGEIEGWRMREPERRYLKQVHAMYGRAHQELVRQVSTQCVERATLMSSIWNGVAAIDARLCDQESYASDVVDRLLTRFSANEEEVERMRRQDAELRLKAATSDVLERQVKEMQGSLDMLAVERDSLRNTVKLQGEEHARSLEALRVELDDMNTQKISLQVEVDKLRETIKNLDARRNSMMARRRSSIAAPPGSALQMQLETLEQGLSTMTPRPEFDRALLPEHLRGADPADEDQTASTKEENLTIRRVQAIEELLRLERDRSRKLDIKARALEEQLEASQKPTVSERIAKKLGGKKREKKVKTFSWDLSMKAIRDPEKGPPRDSFVALGNSAPVPHLMRATGVIRNKKLPKRDTELLCKQTWAAKEEHDRILKEKNQRQSTLIEFTHVFIKKRYGIAGAVAEMAYSFVWALDKYAYDADCELFLKILTGELSEEVYWDQIKIVKDVIKLLTSVDTQLHSGKATGKVPRQDVKASLRAYFAHKKEEDLVELEEALDTDQPDGNMIDIEKLFEEDRDFNQGEFAEALRDQHLKSRVEFLDSLQRALWSKSPADETMDEDGESAGLVDIELVRETLLELDPDLGNKDLETYLARGLGCERKDLANKEQEIIDITTFMTNLRTGAVVSGSAKNRGLTTVLSMLQESWQQRSLLKAAGRFMKKKTTPEKASETKMGSALMEKIMETRGRDSTDSMEQGEGASAEEQPARAPTKSEAKPGMTSEEASAAAMEAADAVAAAREGDAPAPVNPFKESLLLKK